MNKDPRTFNHTMCYDQMNGTNPLGNTTNCDQIAVSGEGAPVNMSGPSNGSYWVQGVAWLCGSRAYFVLPPGWYGVCAPIYVSDHTYVISAEDTTKRRKRSTEEPVQTHDGVWGTDVPDDQKIWSEGKKVILSLFPQVGVGKLLLRVETLTYRLGLFMNASVIIEQQQNNELDVARQMVIQNRMALDLLTAAQGGVCVLLNQTCCTYIPDNVHSSNMTTALQRLKELQMVMAKEKSQQDSSWLSWFTTGAWWSILMKICMPFLLFFILFFCCFITVIPCLKMLIRTALNSAFRAQENMLLFLTHNMETEEEMDGEPREV
uniref:Uncharacterized protein n=1 Tax=Paramormyrops kingsleyae TaxID=1676925 RepID=A0A3B3QVQ3_9TELE